MGIVKPRVRYLAAILCCINVMAQRDRKTSELLSGSVVKTQYQIHRAEERKTTKTRRKEQSGVVCAENRDQSKPKQNGSVRPS